MTKRKTNQTDGTLRQAAAEVIAAWNKAAAGEVVEPTDGTIKVCSTKQPRRTLGLLKDKIGPQPSDAFALPDDLIDIMEGQSEG